MKRTVIKYKKKNNKQIIITGIENVANAKEIRFDFGVNVCKHYFDSDCWYELVTRKHPSRQLRQLAVRIRMRVKHPNKESDSVPVEKILFGVGDILTTSSFNAAILYMKRAGKNLQKAKEEGTEEQTVVI